MSTEILIRAPLNIHPLSIFLELPSNSQALLHVAIPRVLAVPQISTKSFASDSFHGDNVPHSLMQQLDRSTNCHFEVGVRGKNIIVILKICVNPCVNFATKSKVG